MTPDDVAVLTDLAWPQSPWNAAELELTLARYTTQLLTRQGEAFLLAQVIDHEAEILLIATHPAHRRKGLARNLIEELKTKVSNITLEVRADNRAATNLYANQGFDVVGRRRGYYFEQDKPNCDALIMSWTKKDKP